jgi:hypothetical protein
MRYILIFWAAPLGFFWGWYFLSLNDVNFGTTFFSGKMHRLVFDIYGHILGIDPQVIPSMVAKACILDTALIFSIFAFRKRAAISGWWQSRTVQPEAASADSLANMSNAP